MESDGSLPSSQQPANDLYLSQTNPVHTFPSYFPKTHFNIILTTTPRSSEWSLPFRFLDQNLYTFHTSPMRATFSASHPP
jgi:hypothetical protein